VLKFPDDYELFTLAQINDKKSSGLDEWSEESPFDDDDSANSEDQDLITEAIEDSNENSFVADIITEDNEYKQTEHKTAEYSLELLNHVLKECRMLGLIWNDNKVGTVSLDVWLYTWQQCASEDDPASPFPLTTCTFPLKMHMATPYCNRQIHAYQY